MPPDQFKDEIYVLRKYTNKITNRVFSLGMQHRLAANHYNSVSKNLELLFGVHF
jgi:hypothetical protein